MQAYWYGNDTVTPITLAATPSAIAPARERAAGIAAQFGFPVAQDWSHATDDVEDEVLIFVPGQQSQVLTVPGRDDLEARLLAVWLCRGAITNLFFARSFADLVVIVSAIAAYRKALSEITGYSEHALEMRGRYAQVVQPVAERFVS